MERPFVFHGLQVGVEVDGRLQLFERPPGNVDRDMELQRRELDAQAPAEAHLRTGEGPPDAGESASAAP